MSEAYVSSAASGSTVSVSPRMSRLQSVRDKVMKFDIVEWSMAMMSLAMVCWSIAATLVLLYLSNRYIFFVVDNVREWYAVQGSTRWAQAEAERVLDLAFQARDAVTAAVHTGAVRSSNDYYAFERALGPLLMVTPALRSVELAFSDRPALVVVGHGHTGDGEIEIVVQTNARECFMLGLHGCVDTGVPEGEWPPWYDYGMGLFAPVVVGAGNTSSRHNDASTWATDPSLLHQPMETGDDVPSIQSASQTAWFPTYTLFFRAVFPPPPGGGGGGEPLILMGRVKLEFGELSGGRLQDTRLGVDARIYLCDAGGRVLAASEAEDLVAVGASGNLRFRSVWELEDAFWRSEVEPQFNARSDTKAFVRKGLTLTHVTLSWLPEPFDRFVVLTVCPSGRMFSYMPLLVVSAVGLILGGFPYAAILLILCTLMSVQAFKLRKHPGNDPLGMNPTLVTRISSKVSQRLARFSGRGEGGARRSWRPSLGGRGR
mmetsp:Transcript_104109/g.294949  ORF Transcript_104109/g.294949 Transcript_104109/m.294949 type:complete len:486 (-) Transcript_104109:68-1525(-)